MKDLTNVQIESLIKRNITINIRVRNVINFIKKIVKRKSF